MGINCKPCPLPRLKRFSIPRSQTTNLRMLLPAFTAFSPCPSLWLRSNNSSNASYGRAGSRLWASQQTPPLMKSSSRNALEDPGVPYVAIGAAVLRLPPILVWELVQQRANTRLLFLDKVAAQSCHYKTVEGDEAPGPPERITEVAELCSGRKRPAERVELRDGRHLAREWGERSSSD